MSPSLLPAVDPAGLPAPPGLLTALLVFTFFLHLLFMNLTLGGTLMAAVCHALARRVDDAPARLAARLVGVNTFAISLTITTGIAPLLFLQVLYGQLFYTATILLGWLWSSLVVALTLGYYATYVYKSRGLGAGRLAGGVWLWLAAVLFLVVAAIQVAVALAHAQPTLWPELAGSPWRILLDPTYLARFAHFVLAGVTFVALLVAWWSARRASAGVEPEAERAMAGVARRWALVASGLLFVDGLALLFLQPPAIFAGIMKGGGAVHAPLGLAIVLALLLPILVARSGRVAAPGPPAAWALGIAVVAIALMAVTRHQIRVISIGGVVDPASFALRSQWLNFGLFAVLLVAGLGVVAWMVRTVLCASATEP